MRKILLGLAGTALVATSLVAVASAPANAADGDEFIVNGDFSQYDPATGAITDGVTTTQFALTTSLNEASGPGGAGDMYDPGVYAVSTNPGSLHNQWVEYGGNDPKMVLNGFTEGTQTVWQQVAKGVVCDTPGSAIEFEFTADVANVLPLDQYSDGGANIEVIINGQSLGSADLTSNDGTPVSITGDLIPAAASFTIQIVNKATVYIGNDFSLDNLSLKQVGGCNAPTPVLFDVAPTAPTCDAAGSLDTSLFPIDRAGYVLSVDRAFDGPGDYVVTATAKSGFFFEGEGDPFVRTQTVTVLPRVTEGCHVNVGGRTIGFWTNKNGTAAGAPIWNAAKAPYANAIPAGTTFTQAQTLLKASSSTNLGRDMLRAQFIATALNVQYIAGYGDQLVKVPATSAVDGGQTVTVKQYLADINAAWNGTSLDTKAEITSVQNVLNLINQDLASDLFV